MSNFSDIRNIVAKTVLMVIGSVVMLSLFWGYILQGFNLNTTEPKEWSRTDTILLVVAFTLMVGAAYFNKILDLIIGFISKFSQKEK